MFSAFDQISRCGRQGATDPQTFRHFPPVKEATAAHNSVPMAKIRKSVLTWFKFSTAHFCPFPWPRILSGSSPFIQLSCLLCVSMQRHLPHSPLVFPAAALQDFLQLRFAGDKILKMGCGQEQGWVVTPRAKHAEGLTYKGLSSLEQGDIGRLPGSFIMIMGQLKDVFAVAVMSSRSATIWWLERRDTAPPKPNHLMGLWSYLCWLRSMQCVNG